MLERTRLFLNRRTYRGIWETRRSLGSGIKYSVEVGLILRRLPTDNFNALRELLKSCSKIVGAFTLTKLPPLWQIMGDPKDGVPEIKWEDLNNENDISRIINDCYFPEKEGSSAYVLELSVGRFIKAKQIRRQMPLGI